MKKIREKEPSFTTISLKLPKQLASKIGILAAKRKVNRSELVRQALEALVAGKKSRPSALDLAGDLVGCLRGGPPDLATNPKYMEGFGE